MYKFCFVAIFGVLLFSTHASPVWLFRPFNFLPIKYLKTTTTTTAAPVTTAPPVQVSSGYVTGQVFNQTGTGYFPFIQQNHQHYSQQQYPQYGIGGQYGNVGGGGGYGQGGGLGQFNLANYGGTSIGGLAGPSGATIPLLFRPGFSLIGGLSKPLGTNSAVPGGSGGHPVIGGVASANGK